MAGVDIGGEGSSPSSSMGCPRALLELEKDLEVLLPLEVVATASTIVTPAQFTCVEPLCECRCRLQPVPVWSQFTLPGRQLPFLAHFREQDTWTLKDEITGPEWQSIKCWIWESYPGQSDWVPANSWSQCLMLRNPGTILAYCVWHSEDKHVFFGYLVEIRVTPSGTRRLPTLQAPLLLYPTDLACTAVSSFPPGPCKTSIKVQEG